jgi:hypothetical protein
MLHYLLQVLNALLLLKGGKIVIMDEKILA